MNIYYLHVFWAFILVQTLGTIFCLIVFIPKWWSSIRYNHKDRRVDRLVEEVNELKWTIEAYFNKPKKGK
jgi:hypothetical protein